MKSVFAARPTMPNSASNPVVDVAQASPALRLRAKELFAEQADLVFNHADRLFSVLMLVQYIVAIVWATVATPRTWSGGQSSIHPHLVTAILLGGLIALPVSFVAIRFHGSKTSRYFVAVGQMLMGALLIHVSGGQTETHFHVFVSLAFLSLYRDWRILIPATLVVVLDHVVRGIYLPASIYSSGTSNTWRFITHAGWVIFEDVVLAAAILRSVREMSDLSDRQAQLEETNATIELKILSRTKMLRESEERFRAFSEQAADAFFLFNSSGQILEVNKQACAELGYSRDELTALTLTDIEYCDEGNSVLTCLKDLPSEPVTLNAHLRRNNGETFAVEVRAGVILVAGEQCVLALARDATERLRSEAAQRARDEAEKANMAKSRFLSRMSHELRTPLNAVLGFADLLSTDEPNPRQGEYAAYIVQAGKHLLKLIDEVLDISRVESGNISITLGAVSMNEIVGDAVALVTPLASERGLTFVRPSPDDEPVYVVADRQRLYQVVLNLLSNGVKYNSPGGTLTVALVKSGDRVLLSVTDMGPGISQEVQHRVFTPFDRLGAEKAGSVEGTGLGLSLSKSLTEAMGGDLTFQSQPGVGTTFTVDLECTTAEWQRADVAA